MTGTGVRRTARYVRVAKKQQRRPRQEWPGRTRRHHDGGISAAGAPPHRLAAAHAVRRLREGTDDHELPAGPCAGPRRRVPAGGHRPAQRHPGRRQARPPAWRTAGAFARRARHPDQRAGPRRCRPGRTSRPPCEPSPQTGGQAVPDGAGGHELHRWHGGPRARSSRPHGKKSGHGMGWVPAPLGSCRMPRPGNPPVASGDRGAGQRSAAAPLAEQCTLVPGP